MINWIPLNSLDQLQEILNSDQVCAIFKHSTTCGISGMAKRNLERFANLTDGSDLIRNFAESQQI